MKQFSFMLTVVLVIALANINAAVPVEPVATKTHSQHAGHMHHNMTLDSAGMVMNSNSQTLPQDCTQIRRDYQFNVYAGAEFASD